MSGHNKWSKIHRKKGLADAERGNVYARIAKEILVAVKQGGSGDPAQNSRLREILTKARSNNMPSDNIKRAIAKGLGDTAANNYESITYEGYGPAGVAVIVESLTNNKNRTAGDLRSYFDKSGGALGVTGAVSYLFNRCGVITIKEEDANEEKLFELLIESPVDDITAEEDIITVTTKPADFNSVIEQLEKASVKVISANIEWVAASTVAVPDSKAASFEKLIDNLENNEDVSAVFHNAE